MTNTKQQCSTCKFSETYFGNNLECRFNPPQQPGGNMPRGFPMVTTETWCGKWETK